MCEKQVREIFFLLKLILVPNNIFQHKFLCTFFRVLISFLFLYLLTFAEYLERLHRYISCKDVRRAEIYGKSGPRFPRAIYITKSADYREVAFVTFVDLCIETSTYSRGAWWRELAPFKLSPTLRPIKRSKAFHPARYPSCFPRKPRRYFTVATRAAGEKCTGRYTAENNQ